LTTASLLARIFALAQKCPEANIEMRALVAAVIIIVVIVIVLVIRATLRESVATYVALSDESLTMPDAELARIIALVDATQKSKGSLFDFARNSGNPAITPIMYAKLVTLYKNGTLNIANARSALA